MVEGQPRKSFALQLIFSAQQDIAAARLLASAPDFGDAVVGFHAQQAIEKAIKSVLSAHRVEFRRTHDLVTLLDMLNAHQIALPPGADWLDELNPYAVEARYGMINPQGLDRQRALLAAQRVVEWALSLLSVKD